MELVGESLTRFGARLCVPCRWHKLRLDQRLALARNQPQHDALSTERLACFSRESFPHALSDFLGTLLASAIFARV